MPTVVHCPECDTSLKLPSAPGAQKVRCPNCQAIFAPEDAEAQRVSAERPVAPTRPRDDEDDLDRDERRRRRPAKAPSSRGLMIGLIVGGGVLVLLLLTCAGVAGLGFWLYRSPLQAKQQVAKNVPANNPAPAANNNPPPANNNPPADPPMPGPAAPQQPVNPPMPGPGGNQPGMNQYPVTLSNPRVSRLGARMNITVDYKFVKGGPNIGMHLFVIIKSAGGNSYEADIFGPRVRNEGTFDLTGISFRGIDRGPYEIYVETGMPGPFGQRQRASNTVTTN